jgi:hypothetical protein
VVNSSPYFHGIKLRLILIVSAPSPHTNPSHRLLSSRCINLGDHLTTKTLPSDPTWARLDAMVLQWLYESMSPHIIDLFMVDNATAYTVWTSTLRLLKNNKN